VVVGGVEEVEKTIINSLKLYALRYYAKILTNKHSQYSIAIVAANWVLPT
jgi:hypothetical protein